MDFVSYIRAINTKKKYGIGSFLADVLAGLTVATVLVPQGVAYAFLAGMPPIYGLYAALSALVLYPLLSSSRYLAVGPVALVSIILTSGLSGIAEPFSEPYLQLVFLTALISGVMQLLMATFKLGSLTKFLSNPVLKGFVAGAAIVISISQLRVLLSVSVEKGSSPLLDLLGILGQVPAANVPSLILGLVGIAAIILLKKIHKFIPSYLIVVVLSTVVCYFAQLYDHGVVILRELPTGLPTFSISHLQLESVVTVLPTAAIVCLICFISSYSIAKAFEKLQDQAIDANKELLSLGIIKVVGSFFLSLPSSGSFSRSAVMSGAGSRSKATYYVTAAVIVAVLLFFGDYFYYLPLPALAAIIIASVMGLIDIPLAKKLYQLDRLDFAHYLITLLVTVGVGVVPGIVVGVVVSMLSYISKQSAPHYRVLGTDGRSEEYKDVAQYSDCTCPDRCLVFRCDQDLFFGNADQFREAIKQEMSKVTDLNRVVLQMEAVHHIDSTAIAMLESFIKGARTEGIMVVFSNMSPTVDDICRKAGMYGPDVALQTFHSVHIAVHGESAVSSNL